MIGDSMSKELHCNRRKDVMTMEPCHIMKENSLSIKLLHNKRGCSLNNEPYSNRRRVSMS